ncbi:MAG: hypothetical protein [Bacteriophage sp.]|nr:MAG: hypothetical protein [Bacteriophage sp.]
MGMCRCNLCGVESSSAEKHNGQYETLVELILQSGGEKQLVELIRIFSKRFYTGVSTSQGANLLAYERQELYNADVIALASKKLQQMLNDRVRD